MVIEEPTQRAETAGAIWAAQFQVEPDYGKGEQLRGIIASSYSAGWIEGYQRALADAKRVLQGGKP